MLCLVNVMLCPVIVNVLPTCRLWYWLYAVMSRHVVSYCVFSCHVDVPNPGGAVYGTGPMLSCHGMFCRIVSFHVISMDVPDPGGAVYGRVPSPGPPHPRALISEA